MTYEAVARFEIKERRACDLLTVYETQTPLYEFNAGWFYGSAVPIETQISIDQAILTLRLEDKIRELVTLSIDAKMKLNCAAISDDIPPDIVGWLLLTIVSVCMIPVIFAVAFAAIIRRGEAKQNAVPDVQD